MTKIFFIAILFLIFALIACDDPLGIEKNVRKTEITKIDTTINLDSGLIAWWSFNDGTTRDQSGYGNDANLVHDVNLINSFNGFAYSLQGRGEATDFGSHILIPRFDFDTLPQFSISIHVMENNLSYWAGEAYIWFGDQTKGWLGIFHHISRPVYDGMDSTLYLSFAVGGRFAMDNTRIHPLRLGFLQDYRNRWVHYCMTYKDTLLKAYIDGEFLGSIKQEINISGDNAAIARHWWNESQTSTRFIGAFDEIRVYNRALNKYEVAALDADTTKAQ